MKYKTTKNDCEPIMIFENQKQLDTSLEEWQERLGLKDWIITVELSDMADKPYEGGDNTHLPIERASRIRIHREDCYITLNDKNIEKAPQELTLVHELLHCKFTVVERVAGTYDAQIVEWREHTIIEDMAKALIMAKYGITLEWFKIKE